MKHENSIDMTPYGESLLSSFVVHRLKSPKLIWINHDFFLRNGINTLDRDEYDVVSSWLLDEFCYSSTEPAVSGNGAEKIVFADRYGATKGTAVGGSGRCGVFGLYNAKGIGPTPLVGRNIDRAHSHGRLSLKEAVKEVINSRLADEELPFGAVPVIAVIATGETFDFGQGEEPCAIVVRKNFIRPAHFERSIYFGTSGFPGSDQYLDADRVRSLVRSDFLKDTAAIRDIFCRLGEQMGAARAVRLWQGQFITSNQSIDGAMVDFGAFRAVANWRKAYGLPGQEFGSEENAAKAAIESIVFYYNKYSGNETVLSKDIYIIFIKAIQEGFSKRLSHDLQLLDDDNGIFVLNALNQYYTVQQTHRVKVDNRGHQLFSWLHRPVSRLSNGMELEDPEGFDQQLAEEVHARMSHSQRLAFLRWSSTRPLMYFNVINKLIDRHLASYVFHENFQNILDTFINKVLSKSRRSWKGSYFSDNCQIIGSTSSNAIEYLLCKRNSEKKYGLLTFYKIGNEAILNGHKVKFDVIAQNSHHFFGNVWRFEFDWEDAMMRGKCITVCNKEIILPKLDNLFSYVAE